MALKDPDADADPDAEVDWAPAGLPFELMLVTSGVGVILMFVGDAVPDAD